MSFTEVHPSKGKIKLLPEHVIDQIKAGEIIESPGFLLKELIENSVDAGPSRIEIVIKNAGLDLISVADNGHGIYFEDLPLAFSRHATSKLNRFDDLYHLSSHGFRGEALASISSVAKVTCLSKPKNQDKGGALAIEGGRQLFHRREDQPTFGTAIYVQDLFFNTPARLKFIRSSSREMGLLKKIIHSFILAFPHIEFTVQWDQKEKEIYPRSEKNGLTNRMKQLLSKRLFESAEIISVDFDYEDHKINGALISGASSINKFQFLFVNNRIIHDRAIHGFIKQQIQKLAPLDMGHGYCFFIDVPKRMLDVNVHPNKTTVKFMGQAIVYSILSGAIKASFPEKEVTNSFSELEDSSQHTDGQQLTIPKAYQNEEVGHLTQSVQVFTLGSYLFVKNNENQDGIFLLDTPSFTAQVLEEQMKDENFIDTNVIPLLIGSPIKLGQTFCSKKEKDLNKHGIGIQKIDGDHFVVSSLPKILCLFDLSNLLESYFSQDKDFSDFLRSFRNPKFCTQVNFELERSQLMNYINSGIENQLVKILTREHFKTFFQ